ncbi:ATP-grasp domain-containing protein [Bacillus sp. EB01]|uniref:ATP-grasp domain-containing protein n=1 Tax=Bacillus sp. EB01 TaxID=1347086 RepID=UPI0005C68B25|nr:ATP-grasp domain-containing protein [Bacillus sp. EB01]
MDTIIFIGSNKSGTSREAIKTAEQMGFFTVLFTDREKFIEQREEFPDVHQMVYLEDLQNRESLKGQLGLLKRQGKNIKACLSLVDPFVYTATLLSIELGLMHPSPAAIYKMEEKTRVRKALQDLDMNPFFIVIPSEEPAEKVVERFEHSLPLIVKYPQSNGSKDVILAETERELEQGIQLLRKQFPEQAILIEEYLNGPQFLIEVLVWEGKVLIVGVIEQFISKNDRFIVTGYHYPASLSETQHEKLESVVKKVLSTLDMTMGSCHLEMRWVNGEWKLIEINPRVSGGAMNQILHEGTGINLVQEIIKIHLGQEPDLTQSKHKHVFAQFITVAARGMLLRVTGKNRALSLEGVKEVYVKPRKGAILTPPYSLGERYAYVIASAESFPEAKKIAEMAAKEIKFFMEPL